MNATAALNTHAAVWADIINARCAAGERLTVNGRVVYAPFVGAPPASSWRNGSLSVSVHGRRPGTTGTVWVKAGQPFTLGATTPEEWVEAHRDEEHDAHLTSVAAPGYGRGSYCFTCKEYGPSTGSGILTANDVL